MNQIKTNHLKRVLIIAGSDCSGGAGIQADLKTLSYFGVYGMTAITALTAQNTLGVHQVENLPIDFVQKQIDVCISDIGVDAIKIGMVHKAEIFDAIYDSFVKFDIINNKKIKIVFDPVMFAKGGYPLLESDAILALKKFVRKCNPIITPNIPETELLSKTKVKNEKDMIFSGEKILKMGAEAVILKGGHLEKLDLTDYVLTEKGFLKLVSKKINTKNTHGTGCTLASAITANLAKSFSLKKSMKLAHSYVLNGIKYAPNFGKGHGPLNHYLRAN